MLKIFLTTGIPHLFSDEYFLLPHGVLDDHGLAMELADVGQGLRQDLGLVARRNGGGVGHGRESEMLSKPDCATARAGRRLRATAPATRSWGPRRSHARRS